MLLLSTILALSALTPMPADGRLPKLKAEPFSVSDVRVLSGPFRRAEELTFAYLLELDPDRLLSGFYTNAGLKPKAKPYGGWESSGLAGHSLGHYLSACAQELAASADPRFKQKLDEVVDGLEACQKNRPDGCISAIPGGDKVWKELSNGEIRSKGFDLNGLWSPWYTHHKVLAGLLDAYRLAGNGKALAVARRFADWAIDLTRNLRDDQWEQMLACEYGGMNEALADLYAITKEGKYLALAKRFYDHRVLDALKAQRDELSGKHSNTQVPKLIGLARLYELTGDAKDRKAAEFFWNAVVHHHTYVIGGNSDHEYLGPADKLNDHLSTNTAETCNTYNMLKLSRRLFCWEPRAEVADFYERAHLNHILASQDPDTGMVTYFMPLASGSRKTYSDRFNNFTCCHGTGMENHTRHADSVYFHTGSKRLWVNLFMPTRLDWKATGLVLRQETSFPYGGRVSLVVEQAPKGSVEFAVRHPHWAQGEVAFSLNGKPLSKSSKPSSYVVLAHRWKAGDRIDFELPMSLRTEAMPDNPNRVAILYGPVVLAARMVAPEGAARTPVLVTGGRPVASWVYEERPGSFVFRTRGVGRPGDLELIPFFQLHGDPEAVYFDLFSESEWQTLEASYRAEEERQRDLTARTIDSMRIGAMQPERDHDLKAEKTDQREANGRGFRTPLAGGWFEFKMKVDPSEPADLVLTYFGNPRFDPEFEILVDGRKLATETWATRKPNEFFDVEYPLPLESTKGKASVVVRIQSVEGKPAGSVAGARTVRRKSNGSPNR